MPAPANAGGTEVRWTVPSTLTEASQIVPVVQAFALPSKIEKQLVSSLTAAQRSYDAGRATSGNRSMSSFIDKVKELRGTTIPMPSADGLTADAQAVIAAHS